MLGDLEIGKWAKVRKKYGDYRELSDSGDAVFRFPCPYGHRTVLKALGRSYFVL